MKLLGTITMPGVPKSAPAARAFVRGLAPHVEDEAMADIALCVAELVANACEHTASGTGGGQVTVIVSASDDILRVTVLDQGGAQGRPRVCNESCSEDGRGLLLVAALSKSWGMRPALHGTAVWAEFHAMGRQSTSD